MLSLPLKIFYGHIVIVLPIFLAYCLFSATGTETSTSNFHAPEIAISRLLAQNLDQAKTTREHGILTHALLELQNPELTVFAGAGYGVHLRHPNPGAIIEAFPDGKLPQAGGSRYDPWTMVKGLRYAAAMIVTDGSAGPEVGRDNEREGSHVQYKVHKGPARAGEEEKKTLKRGGWLVYQPGDRSAVEAACFGWATLLLERAGAVDLENPVGQRRSAYGEAAEGMIDWLYDGTRNARRFPEKQRSDDMNVVGPESSRMDNAQEKRIYQDRWAVSYTYDMPELRSETVFILPPFLAAYSVARQDDSWLIEAIEQIRIHWEIFAQSSSVRRGLLGDTNVKQDRSDIRSPHSPHSLMESSWALAGTVRVLAVLERWQHEPRAGAAVELSQGKLYLLELIKQTLQHFQSFTKENCTGLLMSNFYHHLSDSSGNCSNTQAADIGKSAFIVSSVYRLAQLGLLENLAILNWADELYHAVANLITTQERSTPVTTLTSGPRTDIGASGHDQSQNEGHSMVLMMYAARRDCVKESICRPSRIEKGRWWPLFLFM